MGKMDRATLPIQKALEKWAHMVTFDDGKEIDLFPDSDFVWGCENVEGDKTKEAASIWAHARIENELWRECGDDSLFGHGDYTVTLEFHGEGYCDNASITIWLQPEVDEELVITNISAGQDNGFCWAYWVREDKTLVRLIDMALQGAIAKAILEALGNGEGQLYTDDVGLPIFQYGQHKYRICWASPTEEG